MCIEKENVGSGPKIILLNQWKERISQFAPDAEIGIIKQNKVNISGKDIVLAMLQSISIKDYPDDTFSSFGFTIIDECHHIGAEVFSRLYRKYQPNICWVCLLLPKERTD